MLALGPEEEEKVLLLLEFGLRVVEEVEVVVPEGRREEETAAVEFCEDGATAVAAAEEGLKNDVRAVVDAAMEGDSPGDTMALEAPDGGPRYIWFTRGGPPRGISDWERR